MFSGIIRRSPTATEASAGVATDVFGSLDPNNIPEHIAVIMDGNGRWAKKQGMSKRLFGHNNAIEAVRACSEGCAELGVKYLTLYAFSTENWGRPQEEVDGLMSLLVHTIAAETPTLNKNQIRLTTIGHTAGLPVACQAELAKAMEDTAANTRMTLVLALNYSGRWDITQAMAQMASKVAADELNPADITSEIISAHMSTANMPDPELLIRTSGELRISNFLLWQLAYTELYITETLWPDFRKEDLHAALAAYQIRDRRFGRVQSTDQTT
jgi:undecaprenyl diphosphate synthase